MADPNFTRVDVGKEAGKADRVGFVWIDAIPQELIVGEVAAAARGNGVSPVAVPGCWYGRRSENGAHGQRAAPNEKVLYVLHGGDYVGRSGAPDSIGVPNIVNGVLEHSDGIFTRALALDYRLSSSKPLPSENPFPGALLDAVAGYRYLISSLGFSPSNTVVEGDSASRNLVVALGRYLVQLSAQDLPVPGGLLLVSPAGDFARTHDTSTACSMERNYASDYIYDAYSSGYMARSMIGALPPRTLIVTVFPKARAHR